MKKLLDISSEERNRILEMHQNATKKNYLMEQPTTQPGQNTQGVDINGTNLSAPVVTVSAQLNASLISGGTF